MGESGSQAQYGLSFEVTKPSNEIMRSVTKLFIAKSGEQYTVRPIVDIQTFQGKFIKIDSAIRYEKLQGPYSFSLDGNLSAKTSSTDKITVHISTENKNSQEEISSFLKVSEQCFFN